MREKIGVGAGESEHYDYDEAEIWISRGEGALVYEELNSNLVVQTVNPIFAEITAYTSAKLYQLWNKDIHIIRAKQSFWLL